MKREDGKVGMIVEFGRPGGQKTRGMITKINLKTFAVRAAEERGTSVRSNGPVKAGKIWRVGPGLCTPIAANAVPSEPSTHGHTPECLSKFLGVRAGEAFNQETDELLSSIAMTDLRVSHWETRNSDRLDFYDVSIGSIRRALRHAFEAGQAHASKT